MLLALGFHHLIWSHQASSFTLGLPHFEYFQHFLASFGYQSLSSIIHFQVWGCFWTLRLLDCPYMENVGIIMPKKWLNQNICQMKLNKRILKIKKKWLLNGKRYWIIYLYLIYVWDTNEATGLLKLCYFKWVWKQAYTYLLDKKKMGINKIRCWKGMCL